MSDQFFWYVTRSAALVAWVAAATSVLIGLATSSRVLGRKPTIPWLVDLHRLVAALSVTFLGVHMVSLWFDSYVRFRLGDLLIPWVASVPGLTRTSIALGVLAAWSLIAVQATSLIRDRLPESLWRATHQLSFVTLVLGSFHAYQAGSDVSNPIVVAIAVSLLTAITLLALVRLVRLRQARPPEPTVDSPPAQQDEQPTVSEPIATGTRPPVGHRPPGPGAGG